MLCYSYFFPRWGDWNQNSRLDLTMAIVDQGTLSIDAYADNTGDYAVYEGHKYSDKAPGASFLGVPVYYAFRSVVRVLDLESKMAGVASGSAVADTMEGEDSASVARKAYQAAALYITMLFVSALPTALLGVLLYNVVQAITPAPTHRLGVVLLYALATGAFPYANSFMGHQLVASLLFAAFYLLLQVRAGEASVPRLLSIGFLLGYALITEYSAALIVVPLVGYAALYRLHARRGSLLWLVCGALPPLVMLAAYDYIVYGTVVPVGYWYSALWQAEHATGFLSLTYPRPRVIWELTFGTYRGLFSLSPALLYAMPGFAYLWQVRHQRPEGALSLTASVAYLAFNSASCMWGGGFAVGPRYLLPALPFFVWPIAYALRRHPRRGLVLYWLLGILSLLSVWAQTIGGRTFPGYERPPLVQVSIPKLVQGEIARNLGMILGLSGWMSLVPLAVGVAVLGFLLWRLGTLATTSEYENEMVCLGGVPLGGAAAAHPGFHKRAWR
jgi:hypothetical protein